jgi:hypothetical protein
VRRTPAAGLLAGGLALALLAGCSGGGSSEAIRATAGAATAETTTTAPATTVAPTTTTSRAAGRPTTTPARAAPATTAAPSPAGPAGARALTPPAAGTYRYDTGGATTFGVTTVPFPALTSLVVDPPAGTRQHSTRNLRDASGNGSVTELTLDYRAGGVYLVALKLTTTFGGTGDSRTFQPPSPVLLLATGARPGAHQEADLALPRSGTEPGPASAAHLAVDVLREERVTIAGQAVDTLVMRAVVTLPPGDVTGRQELTVSIDRASRLWVKERSVADASAAAGLLKLHSEYNATIERVTPS